MNAYIYICIYICELLGYRKSDIAKGHISEKDTKQKWLLIKKNEIIAICMIDSENKIVNVIIRLDIYIINEN